MPSILIVDDSTTLVMSLSRILKSAGYEVTTAADGSEGLSKLTAGLVPAVILTDLHMPKMNGIEFIKEIRRMAATRFTPIVMLTAESDSKKRDEGRAAGASEWIIKPTEPAELIAMLKRILASR
jgi:two-component system chemotaxis response regulator CheY